jgi:VWFA-related protein
MPIEKTALIRFALLLFGCSCLTEPRMAGAQSTKPFNLRVNVELVPVEVIALDKNGKPVKNLKKEDFRLYEDGKQQEILSLDEVTDLNASFSQALDLEGESRLKGKSILILFDDGSFSIETAKQSRDSAALFVKDHMKPQDLFAVASFGQDLKILQNFTNDPVKITSAIAQPAKYLINNSSSEFLGKTRDAIRSENLLRALQIINYSIERIKGQKSVLIFSESDYIDQKIIDDTYKTALNSAKKANVVYDTIDPGGLKPPVNKASDPHQPQFSSSLSSQYPEMEKINEFSLLKILATDTGGSSILNTNDYNSELAKLDQQLSNYYILGFSSNNPKRNGELRKLDVKINLPGIVLKHRQAYLDRRPVDTLANSKAEGKLLDALASPELASQLAIVLRPACFYDFPLSRVLIFAEIGMEKAAIKRSKNRLESNLNIMGIAYAENGSIAGRFSDTLHSIFNNEKAQDIRKMRLPYRSYLKMQPGKYRLKLAVSDESNNLGVVEQSIEVPAIPEQALVISSLVVVANKAPLPILVQDINLQLMDDGDPLVHNGMQLTPSALNKLPVSSAIPIFFRIYLKSDSDQRNLQAKARLTGEKGEELALDPIDLNKQNIAIISKSEAASELDLYFPGAKPGKYNLTLEISAAGSAGVAIAHTDLELF